MTLKIQVASGQCPAGGRRRAGAWVPSEGKASEEVSIVTCAVKRGRVKSSQRPGRGEGVWEPGVEAPRSSTCLGTQARDAETSLCLGSRAARKFPRSCLQSLIKALFR